MMRGIILLVVLLSANISDAQIVTAFCDVIQDVEKRKTEKTMSGLASEDRNLDGSYITSTIPARFSESKFHDLGDGAYFLEFRSYGNAKQMKKVMKQLHKEIVVCYPEHIYEETDYESESYTKLFFCHQSEKGGSKLKEDYSKMTFTLSLIHSEDESKIVLTF